MVFEVCSETRQLEENQRYLPIQTSKSRSKGVVGGCKGIAKQRAILCQLEDGKKYDRVWEDGVQTDFMSDLFKYKLNNEHNRLRKIL